MNRPVVFAAVGVVLAIGITTTMDANGLSEFSSLPLLPLAGILALAQRQRRRELGLVSGGAGACGLAILHPLVVIGVLILAAGISGAADFAHVRLLKMCLNLLLIGGTTILVALLTEEGFFRGWLWGSLERAGWSDGAVLLATSLAFAAWHVSAATLAVGYRPPPAQVPVFLLNALALGLVWGLLRASSGSILVASLGHGVWNGMAYALFGFGERVGALGVRQTGLWGPEVGIAGLVLNLGFASWLWLRRPRARDRTSAMSLTAAPGVAGKRTP